MDSGSSNSHDCGDTKDSKVIVRSYYYFQFSSYEIVNADVFQTDELNPLRNATLVSGLVPDLDPNLGPL